VYFFSDGNPPWDSKKELASYLDRVTIELMLNKIDLLCKLLVSVKGLSVT